jgi:hypothetical protein
MVSVSLAFSLAKVRRSRHAGSEAVRVSQLIAFRCLIVSKRLFTEVFVEMERCHRRIRTRTRSVSKATRSYPLQK